MVTVFALLATATLSKARVDADVTIAPTVMPVEQLLAKLGESSGQTYTCDAKLRGDAIFISVNGKPVAEVLNQVAGVLHAQWDKTSQGFNLTITAPTILKDQKDEAIVRANEMITTAKTHLNDANKRIDFDAMKKEQEQMRQRVEQMVQGGGQISPDAFRIDASQIRANQLRDPGTRALVKILSSMSPQDLARAFQGKRVVFSTSPNALQLPLGGRAMEIAVALGVEEKQMRENGGGMMGPGRGGPGGRPGSGGPGGRPGGGGPGGGRSGRGGNGGGNGGGQGGPPPSMSEAAPDQQGGPIIIDVAPAQAAPAQGVPGQGVQRLGGQGFPGFGGMAQNQGSWDKGVGAVLLIANQDRFGDEPDFELVIADREGKNLYSRNINLPFSGNGAIFAGMGGGAQGADTAKSPTTGTPLEIDGSVKQFFSELSQGNFFGRRGGGGGGRGAVEVIVVAGGPMSRPNMGGNVETKLTAEQIERIMNPDKFDPMTYGIPDLLKKVVTSENTIAYVPDSMWQPFSGVINSARPTLESLSNLVTTSYTKKTNGGWTLYEPTRMGTARAAKVDRKGLAQFIASANANDGSPTIQAQVNYALAQISPPAFQGIDGAFLRYAKVGSFFSASDWAFNRMLGKLQPTELQTLTRGGSITAGQLSSGASEEFRRMTYDFRQGPNITPPQPAGQQNGQANGQLPAQQLLGGMFMSANIAGQGGGPMRFNFGGMGGYQTERTIAMPNGVPRATVIKLQITSQQTWIATMDDKSKRPIGAGELAFQKALEQNPAMAGNMGFLPPKPVSFREAKTTSYNLNAQLLPNARLDADVSEMVAVGNGGLTYNELPAQFRSQVDSMATRMIQGGQRGGGGGQGGRRGGQGAPPPAR
ncbi:MAG: hypothetical protein JST35_02590 [Armatimonadetes bacterium]|nr:hypothetical protein [Armatimonadota bacterium]